MHRSFGYREALVLSQDDRLTILYVKEDLAIEHEEKFILIHVFMPRKVSLKDAKAYDGIVNHRQGLIEPRFIQGDFARDIHNALLTILDVFVVSKIFRQSLLHHILLTRWERLELGRPRYPLYGAIAPSARGWQAS
jgi:hypothetical protein